MKWILTTLLSFFLVFQAISQPDPKSSSQAKKETTTDKIQFWATIITTVLGGGVLSFVIALNNQQAKVKNEIVALKDQQGKVKDEIAVLKDEKMAVKDERMAFQNELLANSKEELDKAEREITEMKATLNKFLNKDGIEFQKLAQGQKLTSDFDEVKTVTNELIHKIKEHSEKLKSLNEEPGKTVADSNLTIAKSQMAQGNFNEAIKAFDYSEKNAPLSWDMYFSKGVAYANLRQGRKTDIESLKAYSDAIVYIPSDIDPNLKARIFGYRGAMNKRLNRLDEAENDLNIAMKHAASQHERDDINYNLSAIYAMTNNKEKMMEHIDRIKSRKYLSAIRGHLHDYYKNFSADPDLQKILRDA